MTHLEVELSVAAFAALLRVLRAEGLDPLAVAQPPSPADEPPRTARPDEWGVLRYRPSILRRLLERALSGLPEGDAEAVELRGVLTALRGRADVGVCVVLAS